MTEAPASAASHRVNELQLLLALVEEFGETGLLVDVGAHVGSFSEAFASRGWDVVAVEAAPEIHAELAERLAAYDRAEVVHAAASETGGGEVEFFLSSEFWGIHSLKPFHETHDKSVIVPTVRVADLLADRQSAGPFVLKVDTEGADLLVLRGVDWEGRRPRVVLCEFMDERTKPHFGYVYTDIVRYMDERGYTAFISEWAPLVEPSRRGKGGGPFTHLQILRAPVGHQPAWGNLFFVAPDDEALFETVLNRYLVEVRSLNDEAVTAALKSADRLRHLEQSILNREGTIEGLKKQHATLAARHEAEVARREAEVAALQATVGNRDSRIARLRSAIEQKNERIHSLKAAMRRRRTRYRWIAGALATLAVGLGVIALLK